MVLTLQGIRIRATKHGYTEVEYNGSSHLISFRGTTPTGATAGASESVKVHIYYKTGTVAMCLEGSNNKATQLFRRNIHTLVALEKILKNPRVHPGAGYFQRQRISQKWKLEGSRSNVHVRDSARRWVYVGNATGIIQNEAEMKTVVAICCSWDYLQWHDDEFQPDLLCTNHSCGSRSGLFRMAYEIVQKGWGDFHTCLIDDAIQYQEGTMSMEDVDKTRLHVHCGYFEDFRKDHAKDIVYLKDLFQSLRKDLRLELCQWFLNRDEEGYAFCDTDLNVLSTNYSTSVYNAHVEYGKLMYPKDSGLDLHRGVLPEVFHNDDEHEVSDNSDDGSVVKTEN